VGKRLNRQGRTTLSTGLYSSNFYSIIEHTDRIVRELDASAKQET